VVGAASSAVLKGVHCSRIHVHLSLRYWLSDRYFLRQVWSRRHLPSRHLRFQVDAIVGMLAGFVAGVKLQLRTRPYVRARAVALLAALYSSRPFVLDADALPRFAFM